MKVFVEIVPSQENCSADNFIDIQQQSAAVLLEINFR